MVNTTQKSDRRELTGHAKMQSVIAHLDHFVFVKNGYSVWMHLIPFAIASLLLLTFSLPEGNLLLNLVKVLQQPSWIWLPAGLLTAVAAVIYFFTIKAQVRRAYLWSDGDLRRTICTSLVYIILCMLMVYAVLMSISSYKITFGTILACLLVAVLSLTGIGWKRSNSWVDSADIKSPNYTEGRASAEKLTGTLKLFRETKEKREKIVVYKKDAQEFSSVVNNLYSDIEKNLRIEPEWAKHDLERAYTALGNLSKLVNEKFSTDNESIVEDFAATCKYQMVGEYDEEGTINAKFKEIMEETLSAYWPEWHYEKPE